MIQEEEEIEEGEKNGRGRIVRGGQNMKDSMRKRLSEKWKKR